MTSDQIAMLTSGGQMQAMAGMQHSAMISQQAGAGGFGESLMGKGVNLAAGMAPIASGGAALMGMDPISLAARGLFSGSAIGAGMGMVGGGVAAGGIMAAQYAAKQAMMGMQQQQQLNSSLAQTFNFQGQTQRGFTAGESGDIGQMLRQASMQRGVGGEFASMAELTTLASRMGQMGMARGVRDVRDFSEKFKQMLDNVKEVAKAFNTNLEQAQEIMSSMRQSGVFQRQGQVAQEMRSYAMAGRISTQEISQSMQTGSQYSRMLGGTGAAGAFGGMKTIGQIGIMQQMGLMSEEQVFNLTGQTGAAGRSALAQQQMGQAAQFLQGGLGRRFIASLAAPGSGGELDEEAAGEYDAGGVGTGRTMQLAGKNLGRTGRASFIRREGRLRGAALARFGGMAPMAVMSQWLEQRGMDPGSDRGIIFMSRRLGISVDEAEQQLTQFRMRDVIEGQRTGAKEDADMWRRIEQQRSGQGIRGVKKSLEGLKNDVNSRLQQWGAEVYTEGSNVLERWVNTVTKQFVTSMDRDIGPAIKDAMFGFGEYRQHVSETRFGFGRGIRGKEIMAAGMAGIRGAAPGGEGSIGILGAAKASGDITRLKESGWYTPGMGASDSSYRLGLQQIRGMNAAYQEGLPEAAGVALDDATGKQLRRRVAMGEMEGGSGFGAISKFQNLLGRTTTAQAGRMDYRFGLAGPEQKMRMMGDVSRAAGLDFDWRMGMPELQGISGKGFRTAQDRDEAIGGYLLGARGLGDERKTAVTQERGETIGTVAKLGARFGLGAVTGGLSNIVAGAGSLVGVDLDIGAAAGRFAEGQYKESRGGLSAGVKRAAGNFLYSEAGRDLSLQALSRDAETAQAATDTIEKRNLQLLRRGRGVSGLTDSERGEYEANNSILLATDFVKLMEETGGKPTEQQKKDFVARTPGAVSWENATRSAQGVLGAAGVKQEEARDEFRRRTGEYGKKEMAGLREAGVLKGGKLSAKMLEGFKDVSKGKVLTREEHDDGTTTTVESSAGESFLKAMTGAAQWREKVGDASGAQLGVFKERAEGEDERAFKALGTMSIQEKRGLSRRLEGMGVAGQRWAQTINSQIGIQKTLEGGKWSPLGQASGAAKAFGQKFGDADLVELSKKSPEEMARILADRSGVTADVAGGKQWQADLGKALQKYKEGKVGEATSDISRLRGEGVFVEGAKKKEEQRLKDTDPSYRVLSEIKEALSPLKELVKKGEDGKPSKMTFDQPIRVVDESKGAESS